MKKIMFYGHMLHHHCLERKITLMQLKFIKKIKKYDTLIGSNVIQDFIFNNKNPINYNFKKTYWPNTQNLKKLYKINNTFF